jgi:hypothetical protein
VLRSLSCCPLHVVTILPLLRYGAIVEYSKGVESLKCPTCGASTCLICKTRSPHEATCRDIISATLAEQRAPLPPGAFNAHAVL